MTRKPKRRPQTEKRRAQVREAQRRWYARQKAARAARLLEPLEAEIYLGQW
jgi:hypothetical protein